MPHSRSWSNVHVRGERGLFANHPIWWKKMFCGLNGQTGLTPVPVWSRWSCRLFYATTKCDLLCQHALNAWQRWLFDKRNRNLARSVNTTFDHYLLLCQGQRCSGQRYDGTIVTDSRDTSLMKSTKFNKAFDWRRPWSVFYFGQNCSVNGTFFLWTTVRNKILDTFTF